ncbi:response regulator transcription factor [Achromobacter sp. Marseille-Q0513]|jgi:DNA-binding NarL/FixJ family response regulator|uniref:response regulator transcription factor n=1 Tax=unclassified Achromobacter TaxID=2626865 RepID=UPI000CD3069E|nr:MULTISPECIES: response regulator transcription factor [unclassified Achromobacter]AUT48970.1 helix-turn-helix transcriptional regulator [Achromobacter sp. AONIH1]MBR8655471.1 response regulator transcription factor [Achromobacter sp. Marseille-Q0513]
MKSVPVLLITHDDLLWQRWRELDPERWLVARGRGLADLQRWRDQGRSLAVLDADLPRLPSWQDAAWAQTLAGLSLLVASASPHDEQGTQVLAAGAQGYCHSYAPPQALAQALEVISTGGIWMGRSLVSRLLRLVAEKGQDAGDWDGGLLTERETTAARYAAGGWANAQIAEALGITERTVKAHLSAVFEKLGVSDRLQLALLVHGISSPSESRSKIPS